MSLSTDRSFLNYPKVSVALVYLNKNNEKGNVFSKLKYTLRTKTKSSEAFADSVKVEDT